MDVMSVRRKAKFAINNWDCSRFMCRSALVEDLSLQLRCGRKLLRYGGVLGRNLLPFVDELAKIISIHQAPRPEESGQKVGYMLGARTSLSAVPGDGRFGAI